MQSAFVAALVSVAEKLWPTIEPLVIQAGSQVLKNVIAAAKAGTFPDRWKAFEPMFDAAADELLKILP